MQPREDTGAPEKSRSGSLAAVVGKLQLAHKQRAWARMRECFHDESRIESVAAGKVLGPDDTVAAIRDAFEEGVYSIGDWETEELRPDVVLSWAGVRRRPPDDARSVQDGPVFWLVTGRDGLMWRVRTFVRRDEALEHLDRFGHDLGL